MAQVFPTPASCAQALDAAGYVRKRPLEVLGDRDGGTTVAIVPRNLPDGEIGCAPIIVTVTSAGDSNVLRGRITKQRIEQYAVVPHPTDSTRDPEPLLYWIDAEPETVPDDDPRTADKVHDGMPADPFGENPGHAALATDAIELKAMLDTYIGAGFDRAEAFELVLAIHQTEMDHQAQHCLVQHQLQGEAGGRAR